jgi:hypothetical protein
VQEKNGGPIDHKYYHKYSKFIYQFQLYSKS